MVPPARTSSMMMATRHKTHNENSQKRHHTHRATKPSTRSGTNGPRADDHRMEILSPPFFDFSSYPLDCHNWFFLFSSHYFECVYMYAFGWDYGCEHTRMYARTYNTSLTQALLVCAMLQVIPVKPNCPTHDRDHKKKLQLITSERGFHI